MLYIYIYYIVYYVLYFIYFILYIIYYIYTCIGRKPVLRRGFLEALWIRGIQMTLSRSWIFHGVSSSIAGAVKGLLYHKYEALRRLYNVLRLYYH